MKGLNQKQQQELLFQKAKINWADYPSKFKNGVGCYRVKHIETNAKGETYNRAPWILDENLMTFSKNFDVLCSMIGNGMVI